MHLHIGSIINKLSYKIKRNVCNLPAIKLIDEISGTNSLLLQYISLNNSKGKPVFQKDIEKEFGITRSTASKVITLMEKKNLVQRVSVENDARLKRLVLTEKAIKLNEMAQAEIEKFEKSLLKGLSEKETHTLIDLLSKISLNLEEIEW